MNKREIISVEQKTNNPYLNMFDLSVLNKETGKVNPYYMVSRRNKDDMIINNKKDITPDAVMIITFIINKEDKPELILLKQYRPTIDSYICEFPAGLVDEGEEPKEAVKRELKEETGLDLIYTIPLTQTTFSSVGISDETVKIYIALAEGEISNKYKEENEEFEIIKIDLDEIPDFIEKNILASKTALSIIAAPVFIGAFLKNLKINKIIN